MNVTLLFCYRFLFRKPMIVLVRYNFLTIILYSYIPTTNTYLYSIIYRYLSTQLLVRLHYYSYLFEVANQSRSPVAVSSAATDLHNLQAALASGNLDMLQSIGQLQHSLQGGASVVDYNALAFTGLPAIDPSTAGTNETWCPFQGC